MGKGDARRPTTGVSDVKFAQSWCETFGHQLRPDSDVCWHCGKSVVTMVREGGPECSPS